MGKKKYYDISKLLSCNCNWNILYGMRSNGKSYAVKKLALENAMKGEQFIYLRRWSEDIKTKEVSTYFDDLPVKEITSGEYNTVTAYQGFFYFANVSDTGKMERAPEPIGRYCSLNQAERYKSQVFEKVTMIIFEEFMTDKVYLGGTGYRSEPRMLMQFVSTVARDRNIKVFMIGNTISRVTPYTSEWSLKNFLQQKPGTIDVYHLRGENGVVDIAVENCEVVETKSRMFFGLASKQITSGEWEVDDVPKLLKPREYYDKLYELMIKYNEFKYAVQLMFDGESGGTFVYVYPLTKERKIERIISNEFSIKPLVSKGLRSDIRAEMLMAKCFKEGKVCFSDNLTGTDFRQIIDKFNLRGVMM